MSGLRILFIVMVVSLGIALFWDQVPIISQAVHAVLDPTAGALLDSSMSWGMVLIAGIISLFITIIQKYTVDNETLRELKKEQKRLNEEMKKVKNSPDKLSELQKQMFPMMSEMMSLSFRPLIYTAIPIILLFRWFSDYFTVHEGVRIFGIFSWFWAYLVFSIIFSMTLRKLFKLP